MQHDNPDWQVERSEPTDVRSEDVRLEFRENRAVVTEQISNIRDALAQYDARMTRIEESLKPIVHIETLQNQLKLHESRMTRIENDWKSLIKWWIGVTGTISGAIIGIAKLLSP